jgi:hypothetical protein
MKDVPKKPERALTERVNVVGKLKRNTQEECACWVCMYCANKDGEWLPAQLEDGCWIHLSSCPGHAGVKRDCHAARIWERIGEPRAEEA